MSRRRSARRASVRRVDRSDGGLLKVEIVDFYHDGNKIFRAEAPLNNKGRVDDVLLLLESKGFISLDRVIDKRQWFD